MSLSADGLKMKRFALVVVVITALGAQAVAQTTITVPAAPVAASSPSPSGVCPQAMAANRASVQSPGLQNPDLPAIDEEA